MASPDIEPDEQHEVMGHEPFCSGYIDVHGKWNNGFACPSSTRPYRCCGTANSRYCCLVDHSSFVNSFVHDNLALLLGITLGAMVTCFLLLAALCYLCKLFNSYRKQVYASGRLYQLHCPSSLSTGAASMYSRSLDSIGRRGQDSSTFQSLYPASMADSSEVLEPTYSTSMASSVTHATVNDPYSRMSLPDLMGGGSLRSPAVDERDPTCWSVSGGAAPLLPPAGHISQFELHQYRPSTRQLTATPATSAAVMRRSNSGSYDVIAEEQLEDDGVQAGSLSQTDCSLTQLSAEQLLALIRINQLIASEYESASLQNRCRSESQARTSRSQLTPAASGSSQLTPAVNCCSADSERASSQLASVTSPGQMIGQSGADGNQLTTAVAQEQPSAETQLSMSRLNQLSSCRPNHLTARATQLITDSFYSNIPLSGDTQNTVETSDKDGYTSTKL